MVIVKEQIRQIISQNNINRVTDIYALLKEGFKDILQELMEAEMDATLGYEKNQKGVSPGTATGSLNRSWSPNTSAIFPA